VRKQFSSPESPGSRILWIGGSPCAGKSTTAKSLARRLDYRVYHCDDHWDQHAEILSSRSRSFAELAARTIENRLRLPIEQQVEDEFEAYRQQFPLILNDLEHSEPPLIAEAAALLPELLAAHGVQQHDAVWIVPAEAFQRRHYAARAWAWNLLKETSDPAYLFDRWMQRDAAFATAVWHQAESLGYHVIVVDGTRPIDVIEHLASQQLDLVEQLAR
jgi:dephospho-CoA kinase